MAFWIDICSKSTRDHQVRLKQKRSHKGKKKIRPWLPIVE